MRYIRLLSLIVSVVSVFCLIGCGNNTQSSTPPPTSATPVSLTMWDQPPAGVDVLAFEVTVSSAVLQPGNVSLLANPIDLEISKLEVETAFLSTTNAPPGNYNSLTVTFAKPELTILNSSGAPISGCGIGQLCELKPPLVQTSVTYAGQPLPLTITADTPAGLVVDLDLMKSIQSDFSINPSLTLAEVSAPPGSDHVQHIDDMAGQVTAINAAQNQFSLQVGGSTGRSITVGVDNRTVFEDFDEASLANAFSSVAVGQVLEVEAFLKADANLLAKEVELEDKDEQEGGSLEGTLVSLDSATQFKMVVTGETRDVAGVKSGNPVIVTVLSGAEFQIDKEELVIPSGLTFASSTDLIPGQGIDVHPASAVSGSPLSTTTARVRLDESHFTARVQSISGSDFVVDNLPGLFSAAVPLIASIDIRTSATTDFENISGLPGLAPGDTVSIAGLLFKSATRPVLIADKIRKR